MDFDYLFDHFLCPHASQESSGQRLDFDGLIDNMLIFSFLAAHPVDGLHSDRGEPNPTVALSRQQGPYARLNVYEDSKPSLMDVHIGLEIVDFEHGFV